MRRLAAACLVILAGCRTTQPGPPFPPLHAATAEEARTELDARAASFSGARSIMRVRVTTPERTQSFRAQLVVPDRTHMELIVYTPIGTTAVVVRSDGDRIQFENHVNPSEVSGSAEDLARPFGFYAADLIPSEMAMLLIGLPPRPNLNVDVTPAGLRGASIGDVTVVFDPPSFPARHALITRGTNRIEVEHLEVGASK